jgi:hypothetical protein
MIVLTGKDLTQVKHRRRISEKEFKVLEETFQNNPKPGLAVRQSLAQQFGMTPRSVEIWFQNRRAKAKQEGKRQATKPLVTNHQTISTPGTSRPSSSESTVQSVSLPETDLPTPPQSPPATMPPSSWTRSSTSVLAPGAFCSTENVTTSKVESRSGSMLNAGSERDSSASRARHRDMFID